MLIIDLNAYQVISSVDFNVKIATHRSTGPAPSTQTIPL